MRRRHSQDDSVMYGRDQSSPFYSALQAADSDASLPSSLHVDSDCADSEPLTTADYRRRCRLLEASLVKFKEKATRVRELFTAKMRDMEGQIIEANRRAAQSEDRCKELETRLACGVSLVPSSSLASENGFVCRDEDGYILQLRAQLQEQRDLRVMEARLVAEKSAKIRDWVSRKVQEMECNNRLLSDENTALRDEVDRLRGQLDRCLLDLQSAKRTDSKRISDTSSRVDSWNGRQRSPYSGDYQQVTDNRVTNQQPSSGVTGRAVAQCAPRIRIERKMFASVNDQPSLSATSSTTTSGSHELLEQASTLADRTSGQFSSECQMNFATKNGERQTSVELTPKEAPSPLTPFLPGPPPNTPHADGVLADSTVLPTTLPRCKKDSQRFFGANDRTGVMDCYGPTMTVDRKYKTQPRPMPPAPPARQMPSWESRIYAMVPEGLQVMLDQSAGMGSEVHNSRTLDDASSKDCCKDMNVPVSVYTVLKGRAVLIRSSPFAVDSGSDSSDTDEVGGYSSHTAAPSNDKTSGNIAKQTMSHEGSYSSLASETSSDYALPPEDGISVKTESSDVICTTADRKPGKCLPVTNSELPAKKESSHDLSGYLLKLGTQNKLWKRWWFQLKNGELFFYKSPRDLNRKSVGRITLDSGTRVLRTGSSLQLFEIRTSKRIYHLATEKADVVGHWIRGLKYVVRCLSSEYAIQPSCLRTKDVISGWVTKVKDGRRRQCWCSLIGKKLLFFRNSEDQTPIGQLSMRNCRIEEVSPSCDSDSDSGAEDLSSDHCSSRRKFTLAIWPPGESPTYLLMSSRQSKDKWLYHLVVSSGGGGCDVKSATEFEQLIARLMSVDGDQTVPYWNDPLLLYTKELSLLRPLTTIHSDELQRKALEIFRLIRSFTWLAADGGSSGQMDSHVSQAQLLLSVVISLPELQSEFYCQLIKQTSKHPPQTKSTGVQHFLLCGSHSWFQCDSSPTSPTNSAVDLPESKLNPPHYVLVQGWQLLTMTVSLFAPRNAVLWLLRAHLQRYADSRTESGKYAIFCQCALERMMRNGVREQRPSRMEVLSILLHNPYYHSQPISIPVHFMNGSYQVVSFDGSTTVLEFLLSLEKSISVRDSALSGFALFADDPIHPGIEHCLPPDAKLCDIISKWEQDYSQSSGSHLDLTRTIRLMYKNRLYFAKATRNETEKERLLLVYQMNSEVVAGRFPATYELALQLAALMAQMEYGDLKSATESTSSHLLLKQALDNFFPARYRPLAVDDARTMEQQLAECWSSLRGKGSVDCARVYLTVIRKWTFFGAKLFAAKWKRTNTRTEEVWMAVYEEGIAILDFQMMIPYNVYNYSSIVTFGGYHDDFLLVISGNHCRRKDGSERQLFTLTKHKIAEAVELTASYINTQLRHISDVAPSHGSRRNTPLRSTSVDISSPSVVGTIPIQLQSVN